MQQVLQVRTYLEREKLNLLLEKGWKVVNISHPTTEGDYLVVIERKEFIEDHPLL